MSIGDMILAAVVVVLGAAGTYLMLPHRHGLARPRPIFGAGAVAAGLATAGVPDLLEPARPVPGDRVPLRLRHDGDRRRACSPSPAATRCTAPSGSPRSCCRRPGSSCWPDAPFLAAGTIIVYAGAIIVTFLFVIMLAQMEGKADYDRAARSPGLGDVHLLPAPLVPDRLRRHGPHRARRRPTTPQGRLAHEKNLLRSRDRVAYEGLKATRRSSRSSTRPCRRRRRSPRRASRRPTVRADGRSSHRPPGVKPNVAGLGASLYTDHLVTVGHRRRVALRGPDRGRGDHQPPAADPTRHGPVTGRRAGDQPALRN